MLTVKETMDAVEEILRERFPEEPVYRNLTPTGFVRPSFLLVYGPRGMTDASCGTLEVTAAVTVTAFVPVDEYHNSHIDALQERAAAVQELFAVEGLRVVDRVLSVTGSTAVCNFDFAEIEIKLRYQDDRPGAGEWPLMGEVDVRVAGGQ